MAAPKNKPPVDFDDNPEWDDATFVRARPASEMHGAKTADALVRKRGRPKLSESERKQLVSMRLSPDVLDALRATGEGWQTRVDDMLRTLLGLAAPSEGDIVKAFVRRAASAPSSGMTLFERMANLSRNAARGEPQTGARTASSKAQKKEV
jgi:uncharacterized protein (DUF4415 family)